MSHGKHKTVPRELKQTVAWLNRQPEIKKIVLGRTEVCRHKYKNGHLNCRSATEAGIKCTGYFGSGILDLFLVIDAEHISNIQQKIEDKF